MTKELCGSGMKNWFLTRADSDRQLQKGTAFLSFYVHLCINIHVHVCTHIAVVLMPVVYLALLRAHMYVQMCVGSVHVCTRVRRMQCIHGPGCMLYV